MALMVGDPPGTFVYLRLHWVANVLVVFFVFRLPKRLGGH